MPNATQCRPNCTMFGLRLWADSSKACPKVRISSAKVKCMSKITSGRGHRSCGVKECLVEDNVINVKGHKPQVSILLPTKLTLVYGNF